METSDKWALASLIGLAGVMLLIVGLRGRTREGYDPITGKWVPIMVCPSNMWWNPCTALCENRMIDQMPEDCPDIQSWNRCTHTCETTPQCPNGTIWNPYIRLCQYPPITL